MILSGSLLNANQAYLGDCIQKAESSGVDEFHLDVTNGIYVKNISFGPQTVADIQKVTKLPLDIHLELDHVMDMIELYGPLSPECITVQADCCPLPLLTFQKIRSYGARVGLAFSACTSPRQYEYYFPYVDELLIMSVEPGFGGQPFAPHTFQKIAEIQSILQRNKLNLQLGVDGGINEEIGKSLLTSGVQKLVVGSAVFGSTDIAQSVSRLKQAFSHDLLQQ